ncbi:MAG: ABC transporter substrate-binding protein [Alphaproteobacteria bacterium]|nr:ABC transporter substrate-binding protein [Alphaproteobacteria bacterium]
MSPLFHRFSIPALAGLVLSVVSAPAQAESKSFACGLDAISSGAAAGAGLTDAHALSMFGDVKYGPDFSHFDYVDPSASKGGTVKLATIGTFDTLNPFTLKGVSGAGSFQIYDTLLVSSADEAFTEYGLLAETITMPEDRSSVTFTLRDGARWHDGQPITGADVIWSLDTLKTKGNPFYRQYYADVASVEEVAPRTVRFNFDPETTNRELPLIVGQFPILPKHYWETRDFEATTLEPPLGSAAYRIAELEPGRSVTLSRVEDYWGRDLPVNMGRYNIDTIRYDYYRDAKVAIEAFKAGEYDFRLENNSKEWATAYDIPEVGDGTIVKTLIDHEQPTGMQGFWLNTRRAKFADPAVREALGYTFDFEWTNQNLFYGQYTRTASYFSNTELAASGEPEGREAALLDCYRDRVPAGVFETAYVPPTTEGSSLRRNLRTASKMLEAAGWTVQDGKRTNASTGEAMVIEFLLVAPAFERIVGPVVKNMERLGIEASIRIVDPAQYQNRIEDFDYDVVVGSRGQSLSPGNEQRNYWTTASADIRGSGNLAGVRDAVVDELVDLVIQAPDREGLIAATRALDRVLLAGHYVIPNWHIRSYRVVYWTKFGHPPAPPKYGLGFPDTWWVTTP